MGFLNRLGIKGHAFYADRLALVDRSVLGPQHLHHLDIFTRTKRAIFEGHADCGKFLLVPSDPDPEDETAVAQDVERGDGLGGHEGITQRHDQNARRDLDFCRYRRRVRQREHRIMPRFVGREAAIGRVAVSRFMIDDWHHMIAGPE